MLNILHKILQKKKLLTIGLMLAALVAVAGCGGESAQSADGKTSVKTLISSNEPPLGWADEDGALHGYEYDVLQAVNQNLKSYKLDIQAVPPETMDVLMESGEGKAAAEGYFKNAQREKNFLIPDQPIGVSAVTIYTLKGNEQKYKNMDDVVNNHLRISPFTPNGGIFRLVTEWNRSHGNPLPEIPIQSGLSVAERIRSLASGQYDVFIAPNNLGVEEAAAKENVNIAALEQPLQVNPTVVLVNKNEPQLASEINAALGKLRADGTLSKISEKWYKRDLFKQLDNK